MLCDMFSGTSSKITPGIGVSLFLGAVGSVYLIIQSGKYFSKLSHRKRSSKKPNEVCYMCNINLDLENTNSFVACKGCERLVCKNTKCSEWISSIGIWECTACQSSRVVQQKAGEWLLHQLNLRIRNPGPVDLRDDSFFGFNEPDDTRSTSSSISSNQKVKVREFIEELLSSLLNGSLDDVSVGQLCKNENYLPLWEGQEECPSDKHIELKRMIQKIIEEVSKIPDLLNQSGYPDRKVDASPFFDPKKYEQLLATAVLNKVVDGYRNDKNFQENSSGIHSDSEFDSNHNLTGKQSITTNNAEVSADQTQMSFTQNDQQPKNELNLFGRRVSDTDESYLSDYIQKHKVPLPDLSDSTSTGDAEDDAVSLKSNGTDGTWEENWLFKKRQLKSNETTIAMLVPSPTEDVKALIGDKNADEVSDLSEAGSDNEYDEPDSSSKDLKSSNIASLTSVDDTFNPDSLISFNSIPYNESIFEAKNELLLLNGNLGSNSNVINDNPFNIEAVNKTGFPIQNETENREEKSFSVEENNNVVKEEVENLITDDSKILNEIINGAPQMKEEEIKVTLPVPVPVPRTKTPAEPLKSEQRKPEVSTREAQQGGEESPEEDDDLEREDTLIPGSIAEREHLKWQNAAPIANNPYSADALQRRLQETERKSSIIDIDIVNISPEKNCEPCNDTQDRKLQTVLAADQTDYKRYGRDYYINEAKKASGARKRFSELSSLSYSTDDEKSMLLSQKVEKEDRRSPLLRSNSFGNEEVVLKSEDIFSSRPIQLAPDDPILENATKLDYLSTDKREFYLIPVEDAVSPQSPLEARQDSFTYSEDSDTTRIYDIQTGETKLVKEPKILPTQEQIDLKPKIVDIKPISPETIRLFAPKKLPIFGSNSSLNLPGAVKENEKPRRVSVSDFSIIEKDVIDVLPSVKELAKHYTAAKQESNLGPIIKPTEFIRQISEESENGTENITAIQKEIIEIKKIPKTKPAYNPPTYHAMAPGHSITARSLSKQIRDELKLNATDDHKEKTFKRPPSPERPPSPVLLPGHTKSSIQFFENLKNNK